jgi:polyisoprenoid-binding protein YceI
MFRIICLSLLAVAATVEAQTFKVDAAHSTANFSISHLTVSKTRGTFDKFEGSWEVDAATRTLKSLTLTFDVDSINTKNEKRDKHLKNADFFDVPNHPKMTFVMKKYVASSQGKGKIIGQLTMRGTTRPIEIDAEIYGVIDNPFVKGKKKTGMTLTANVPRLDYGVGKDYGEKKVGEQVAVVIELEGDD